VIPAAITDRGYSDAKGKHQGHLGRTLGVAGRGMKRRVPLPVIFAIALAIAALLPLYIERTMTEVMFADGSGGRIDWAWKRCTLRDYFADYRYMRREQKPAMWFAVDVVLMFAYASVIAAPLNLAFRRRA
jgi:hypothetical protein